MQGQQTSGFAILRKADSLAASYDLSMVTHQAKDLFQELCRVLYPLPRAAYRGISRDPLQPLPFKDPEKLQIFENVGCDVHSNYAACLRFLEIIGGFDDDGDHANDLLPSFSAAREVFSLLEAPLDYEIIQLARYPFISGSKPLGFDIGYWGGDHFSLICDSAVCPTWHPPQPKSFERLAKELSGVNEHFLFPSVEDAERFRDYYRTEDWAETECFPNQFCIIQVTMPKE